MQEITNIRDCSDSLKFLDEKISNSFYGVGFCVKMFTIAETGLAPSAEDVKEIYCSSETCSNQKCISLARIQPILLDAALERVKVFFSFKGNEKNANVEEDKESAGCKENFLQFCQVILKQLLQCERPISYEVLSDMKSCMNPWASWGFCLVFINVKTSTGLLILADASF